MAVTDTIGLDLGETIIKNTDVDQTSDDNLFGGAGTLTSFQIIASGSSTPANWYLLSLSDATITVGTDEPEIKIPIREGNTLTVHITDVGANGSGIAFTSLSEWGLGASDYNDTSAPSNAITSYVTVK